MVRSFVPISQEKKMLHCSIDIASFPLTNKSAPCFVESLIPAQETALRHFVLNGVKISERCP
jgi:hypothetical protein